MDRRTLSVPVWDSFVRIGHWTLVAAFTVAYVSAGDALEVHEWAGYAVAAYLIARVIWGVAGPKHARFADFCYTPRQVFTYLSAMLRGHAKRYLGHSPAGGAMVFVLLIMLFATTATGLAELAASRGEGPLSGLAPQRPATIDIPTSPTMAAEAASGGEETESALQELHELFANLTLALILLHIVGVIAASMSHRENLVFAMVTGRKRAEPGSGS